MDDEKLILLVQGNECIYNKYCPGYKIPDKKKEIWKQISIEMEYPEEICQKRWSCLREGYAKEKRQKNLPSDSGAKYVSTWPLMNTMEFVDPYIVPRPMRYSKNIYKSNLQSPISASSSASVTSPASVSPTMQDISEEEILFRPILPSPKTPRAKRRKIEENNDKQFSQALDSFQKLCESKIEKPKEEDALDGFGKMIVSTIRTMSETKQIVAMKRVTSLVMDIKMEAEN